MGTEQPITLEERKESGQPLVLVVDDDPIHLKILSLLAKRLQITAHLASSCAEAREALNLFSFDVILMDYRMPEVDGCMCAKTIREMNEIAQIPIIAITADVMPGVKEACIAAGMDDFLGKPFTLNELQEKLSYWLQKKTE